MRERERDRQRERERNREREREREGERWRNLTDEIRHDRSVDVDARAFVRILIFEEDDERDFDADEPQNVVVGHPSVVNDDAEVFVDEDGDDARLEAVDAVDHRRRRHFGEADQKMGLGGVPDVLRHDPVGDGLGVKQRARFVVPELTRRVSSGCRRVRRNRVVLAVVVARGEVEVPVPGKLFGLILDNM